MPMHLEGPTPVGWTKEQRKEHATLSMRLTRDILHDHMPAPKRLECFRYMAKRFPGVGWEDAVTETEAIVAKAGT